MNRLTHEELADLRRCYPKGSRVKLVRMNDPYCRDLKPGMLGTVIEMHPNNRILFVFADGHMEEHFWKDHSRRDSWNAEKRKKAAEKTKAQHQERKERVAQ